ncbi:unnamed protein product [marine sediment metagenome]|uniref:Replication-associated protein ORF2/G2P domain-containing protein n=1 Tax=marine sediment metagenome TaxID=412755 RepID=X1RDF4_9ZZZZ
MSLPSVTTTKQNRTSVLKSQVRAERTSESVSGTPAVAVSGNMARGAGEVILASSLATNKGGGGGGSPLLDNYDTTARQSYAKAGVRWKILDENRRVRRFYQRYFSGVGVGGRLRFLTLTSSDEAVVKGYDIHKHFRALVMRLRRRWGRFEYMGVVEIKGDRQHLHLVFRGEYMAQVQLSAMWASIHKSPVVDIKAVYRARGGARYLAKYLAKEGVNRYWASYNWVFAGWVGWSRRVKRAVGHYPSRALLRSLAVLDKVKRRLAMDFLEYQYRPLWEATLDKVNGY